MPTLTVNLFYILYSYMCLRVYNTVFRLTTKKIWKYLTNTEAAAYFGYIIVL